MDEWVSTQWEAKRTIHTYARSDTRLCALRKTALTPGYLVRYADDFLIITDTRTHAEEWKARLQSFLHSKIRGVIQYSQGCTWASVAMQKHGRRLQLAQMRRLKQYTGKWIPANQTQNLPHVHQQYKQKIPSVKYHDIYVGFTAIAFCSWEKTYSKNQDETPYTEAGRQAYFQRTKKKRINARLDEMYPDKTARVASYGQRGKLNNFEFIMNRAYALNRDKLKYRVCGGWLISATPWAHRINPNLPLDKVNRVIIWFRSIRNALWR